MTRTVVKVALVLVTSSMLAGCQSSKSTLRVGDDDMETFVQFMSPATFKIEAFTKPVSFGERGNANGLEVVASTLDAANDPVKVVGTFHIELYRRRSGGGDQRGSLINSWEVETTTPEGFLAHWEKFGRYYRFIVRLDTEELPTGAYILNAWVNLPDGERVFAESFTFEHAGPPVPPVIVES
ncbi:MAG: hypothetical protein AB7N71_13255 [Phycisphaerae bacterium]